MKEKFPTGLETVAPSKEGIKKEKMKKRDKRGKGAEEDPILEAELKKLAKEHEKLVNEFGKL